MNTDVYEYLIKELERLRGLDIVDDLFVGVVEVRRLEVEQYKQPQAPIG